MLVKYPHIQLQENPSKESGVLCMRGDGEKVDYSLYDLRKSPNDMFSELTFKTLQVTLLTIRF
jgi:hypothetical protein